MIITNEIIERFSTYLKETEHSDNTLIKYVRDVRKLRDYACGRDLLKELIVEYKRYLETNFKSASVNSMLAATNKFLDFLGFPDYKVKPLKLQKNIYLPEDKELKRSEYERLVKAKAKSA